MWQCLALSPPPIRLSIYKFSTDAHALNHFRSRFLFYPGCLLISRLLDLFADFPPIDAGQKRGWIKTVSWDGFLCSRVDWNRRTTKHLEWKRAPCTSTRRPRDLKCIVHKGGGGGGVIIYIILNNYFNKLKNFQPKYKVIWGIGAKISAQVISCRVEPYKLWRRNQTRTSVGINLNTERVVLCTRSEMWRLVNRTRCRWSVWCHVMSMTRERC